MSVVPVEIDSEHAQAMRKLLSQLNREVEIISLAITMGPDQEGLILACETLVRAYKIAHQEAIKLYEQAS